MVELKAWNEIEADTLRELLNMGMGRASAALSQLTGEPVDMDIPRVVLDRVSAIMDRLFDQENDSLVAVRERFSGAIDGNACLIFPDRQSLELIRIILPAAASTDTIEDVAQEALTEVGNIVLNATLGSLGNFLDMTLETGIPTFEKWSDAETANHFSTTHAVMMEVAISLRNRDVHGYLITLMQPDSIEHLQQAVNELSGNPQRLMELMG